MEKEEGGGGIEEVMAQIASKQTEVLKIKRLVNHSRIQLNGMRCDTCNIVALNYTSKCVEW